MAKLQTIKRKGGNTTSFMYFPKGDLEKAGFRQEEELIIHSRPGCIIISNSSNIPIQPSSDSKNTEPDISALDGRAVLEAVREFGEPVDAQKELAIQVKNFLDHQIERELREKGYLTDATRRWVAELREILDKIQKAIYGDKSVNLHMHKLSHSHIAMMMRKVVNNG